MDNILDDLHNSLINDDGNGMQNIYEAIRKAQVEAEKQNIRANTVIISPEFHYIREHIHSTNALMPPMLCGMKAYIDKSGELPEEYAFAIVDSDPQDNKERIRAEYLAELRELSVDDLINTVYGISVRNLEE